MDALRAHRCLPELVPCYEGLGFQADLHDMQLTLRGDVSGAKSPGAMVR